MADEIDEKTGRLVELLGREGLGGVLLNAQHNFAWLTGGGSNGVDHGRENGVSHLLVTADGKKYVLANNIEMPRMLEEEVSAGDFEAVEFSWQDEKASSGLVVEKARRMIDGELATDIVSDGRTRTIEASVAKCRHQLTPGELERFRSLGSDAGKALRLVIGLIEPGETEREIAAKMCTELASGGMTSVVTLVAADERIAKFRHPVPSANRWKKTLLLVTCAKQGGLIASLSRIICVGDVPENLQGRTEAAAYVNARLSAATRPGMSGADLYATASAAYAEQGFADEINKHHQGGAAGYKTREWVAHPTSGEIVQRYQAFAWNPSIAGTKVEDTVIVSETGIEVITVSPDFPSIEISIDGRTILLPEFYLFN